MLTFYLVLVYRVRRRPIRQLSSLSPQSFQAIGLSKLEDRATAFNKYNSDCALDFELEKGYELHKNRILPIFRKEKINPKGSTGDREQVEVL